MLLKGCGGGEGGLSDQVEYDIIIAPPFPTLEYDGKIIGVTMVYVK